MPIIGGKVTRLEVERMEENAVSNLEFQFNIEGVRQDKKIAVVTYTTTIVYHPSVAKIKIAGELYFEEEERKIKAMIDEFKDKKKLPNDVAEDVITSMNFSSTAVGTIAAFALGLNAPLNIPRAKVSDAAPAKPATNAGSTNTVSPKAG